MKKIGLGGSTRREDLHARLDVAERRLRRLLEDVERDRDRLGAESLTLRFVWHQEGSPLNRLYLSPLTNYGPRTGYFFGSVVLPLRKGVDSNPRYCHTYLFAGDSKVCECFARHCREAEAIFGRMAGDGTRFNWAKELFESFWNADDETCGDVVEWREVEAPDHPEAFTYIAELIDVFECTRKLLEIFQNGAELRLQSPDGRLPDDEVPNLTKPDGELSASVDVVRGVYEWAISNIPNADGMTIKELFDAIQAHPEMKSDFLDRLPDNPDTFGTYLRRAGIHRYDKSGTRARRQSRRPRT